MVYLRAPIDVILERIQKRGRSFERNIDPGYLKDLIGAYDRFFTQMDDCPVLIVDTEDLNFPNEQSHLKQYSMPFKPRRINPRGQDMSLPVHHANLHYFKTTFTPKFGIKGKPRSGCDSEKSSLYNIPSWGLMLNKFTKSK